MAKLTRRDVGQLAIAIGAPIVGGQLSSLLCLKDVKGWYTRLRKPRWTPPNWVFMTVWPLMYVGQGVCSWLVWRNKIVEKKWPLGLYGAQLVLSLLSQPLMFKLHRPDVATWESCLLLGLATSATAVMADTVTSRKSKAAIGSIMGAYVGWLAFATALSAAIARSNPNAQELDTSPAEPVIKEPKPVKNNNKKKGKGDATATA